MQKHNASLLDILRGSIIIPGELLSSRAHFRLMNSEAKLNRNLYIYNLSKIREGYAPKLIRMLFTEHFTNFFVHYTGNYAQVVRWWTKK